MIHHPAKGHPPRHLLTSSASHSPRPSTMTTRSHSVPASHMPRKSGDEQAFRQLLQGNEPVAPVAPSFPLYLFDSVSTKMSSEVDIPASASPFTLLEPHLAEGIEQQETLPAEFSLLLPEMGEVTARMTAAQEGNIDIALGFSTAVLARIQGYEREGQTSLSRRLGKSVRLRFKLREAL